MMQAKGFGYVCVIGHEVSLGRKVVIKVNDHVGPYLHFLISLLMD